MVLYGHLVPTSPWHTASDRLFTRAAISVPPIALHTCALTFDELVFNLLQETVAAPPFEVTRSRSQYLQRHPEVVRQLLFGVEGTMNRALDLVTIEPVTPSDIAAMLTVIGATGLLPRDAIHLSVMRRLGITAIASDDDAFDGISGITLFKP